jgi:hypothetical protein
VKLQPVTSSNVQAIGYDAPTMVLHVEFKQGGTYEYVGVPPKTYNELLAAPSKGQFLHREIKPHYPAAKL